MKIVSIADAFAFAVNAAAWDLKVFMEDCRAVNTHGTLDSGRVNYDFNMTSPVNRAVSHGSTFADTFELCETKNCKRKVHSYKVYWLCVVFDDMFLIQLTICLRINVKLT